MAKSQSSTSTSSPSSVSNKEQIPSQESAKSLGTLWTMRRSPFSSSVKVVVHLSGRSVDEVPFVPLLSYFPFFFRFGMSSFRTKLTAPIFKTNASSASYIRDSLAISSYVDGHRESKRQTLFPPDQHTSIIRFNEHATALSSFMRNVLVKKLTDKPEIAQETYMPRPLRGWFFSGLLVRFALWLFAKKYAHESAAATRARARQGLEETRRALELSKATHLRYLCGDTLTYADIVMAESLFFDVDRHIRFADLYRDDEFAESFPDLIAWAAVVRRTHYPELTHGRRRPRPLKSFT